MCLLPLLAWLARNWFYLGLIGALPALVPLFFHKIIPTSPRWLLARNRLVEASLTLEKIGKCNRKELGLKSGDILEMLKTLKSKEGGGNQGLSGIFSHSKLATNAILLGISSAMDFVLYFGITINTTNLSGNQFLDFFILSIVELPAMWLGMVLTPRVGRRWISTVSYGGCFLAFGIAAISSQNDSMESSILPLMFLAK